MRGGGAGLERDHPGEPGRTFSDHRREYSVHGGASADRAMARTHALNGTVVVQDVHTGQILALAIRPAFDPNLARRTDPQLLKIMR